MFWEDILFTIPHCTKLQCGALHYTTLNPAQHALHFIQVCHSVLHHATLLCSTLHDIALHVRGVRRRANGALTGSI